MEKGFSSWIKFTISENIKEIKELEKKKFPVEKGEIFIDWGENIPDYYNKNYLRVLVQDPYRIFVYWELDLNTVSRFFSNSNNRLILKIHNLTDNITIPINVGNTRSWWVYTSPGKKYRASLLVKEDSGTEIELMKSKIIITPRDTISLKTDEYEIFSSENLEFFEILTLSGAQPIKWDFLEKLKNYPKDEPLFKIPEILLKYLPLWLRFILKHLNMVLPLSFFIEYILKVYFPIELHSAILRGEITPELLEKYIKSSGYEFNFLNSESSFKKEGK